MFHVISGWLSGHARRDREQLARDNEFAAMNGWQARQVSSFGRWEYRDPRFGARHAQAPTSRTATWAQASLAARIRALPLTIRQQAGKRGSG